MRMSSSKHGRSARPAGAELVRRLSAKPRSLVLVVAAGGAIALAAVPTLEAGPDAVRVVGAPGPGDTAFEFIGRDDQPDLSHAVFYGYVTHLSGVPDAALFSSRTSRTEKTARITFRVNLTLDAHLALQPLFVTSGSGRLRFYFKASPGATFGDPASFSRGVVIATSLSRFHDIVNAQSQSLGIESSTGAVIQRTAGTVRLNGRRYRFGRVGLRERFTAVGEGMRQTTPTVERTIIASGDAVVSR
jgi:hypothetical protein